MQIINDSDAFSKYFFKRLSFVKNCRYLNLKHLEQEYDTLIRKAEESDMGYAGFLRLMVASEVYAKTERSISYRLEASRLPKPYKLLDDFDARLSASVKKKTDYGTGHAGVFSPP